MATGIYILTGDDGFVCYVGKTVQKPKYRLRHHIKRLSRDDLKITVIEYAFGHEWITRECLWINYFRWACEELFNKKAGGGGCPVGYRHTEEAKQKIAEASKQRPGQGWPVGARHTPETIAKMRQIHKGKIISPEQRASISKTLTGRRLTNEETRAKLRNRGFSEAHRAKLSDAARKQWAAGRGWK